MVLHTDLHLSTTTDLSKYRSMFLISPLRDTGYVACGKRPLKNKWWRSKRYLWRLLLTGQEVALSRLKWEFEPPRRHQTLTLDWSFDGLPLRLCEVEPPSRLEETEDARMRLSTRMCGHMVIRSRMKNQNIAERRQSLTIRWRKTEWGEGLFCNYFIWW